MESGRAQTKRGAGRSQISKAHESGLRVFMIPSYIFHELEIGSALWWATGGLGFGNLWKNFPS